MTPWDGTCRGDDVGKIIELLQEFGPMAIADVCKKMNRCTRYICSLIEESEALHYTREYRLKRDNVVWCDENFF